MQHGLQRNKNISKFNHFRCVALNSRDRIPFDSNCCAMQQRVFMGRCLGISVNSKSDCLKPEAEHCQHCYQCIENASPCLHRRIQEFKLGGCKVERQRREPSRGAEGAKRGGVPSPQKFFLDFKVTVAYFCGLCAKFRFFYDHNSIEIQQ